MNGRVSDLYFVAEREERLLREEGIRNRELERLRAEYEYEREEGFKRLLREEVIRNSEYVGDLDAHGHVPYKRYALSLQTHHNPHHPDPAVFEREMPNYGVERQLSRAPRRREGHDINIRDPPPSFYDRVLVPATMPVERNPVRILSGDLIVHPPLESYGTVNMRRLPPGEQSLPRNDGNLQYRSSNPESLPRNDGNLHYRSSNPQYQGIQQRIDVDMKRRGAPRPDVYQERMETDMRQHNPQVGIYQQRVHVDRKRP